MLADRINIKVFSNKLQLSEKAAERWVRLYRRAITERGVFHVALAGGNTPRQLYRVLSGPDFSQHVDWQHVHLYFGDERFVPPENEESNFRMVKETLLDSVSIPSSNIHRIETERGDPHEVAARYEAVLTENLPKSEEGVPQFDLILLGIGPDGHTASLFPGTDVLHQRERFVAAVYVKQKSGWRITLTFPVLEAARHLMFMVAGKDKREVMERILSSRGGEEVVPVQMLEPRGEVEFFLDAEAAGEVAKGRSDI